MKHQCPVCGFDHLKEAPRSESGGASMEICPACGFQFGVSDDDECYTYDVWRSDWIKSGMKWATKQKKPEKWNPVVLIERVVPTKKAARKKKG